MLKSYSERKLFGLEVQRLVLQTELQQKIQQMELLRSDSRLRSLIILLGTIYTGGKSLQNCLRDTNLQNDLGFNLYAVPSICCMVAILEERRKSKMEVSTNQYVAIEHQKLSLIRVIFIDYQTSRLQCNYQFYIQRDNIEDAWSFSSMMLQTQVLRIEQVNEPCIGLTQENLIKSSVQSCLSYISNQMICANYCIPYLK